MPDRRRRTAFRLPLPARAALLMRERQSSSPDSSPGSSPAPGFPDSSAPSSPPSSSPPSSPDVPAKPADDNPFAAPPADRPDQPWQQRHPSDSDSGSGSGSGEGSGSGGRSWGSQWSNKQPGRGNGGFGSRSGSNGPGGKGGPDGGPAGPRWDPTDPSQRRARYALLGGMWSIFFALFEFSEIALLLGSLSVYWAVSSLRAEPKSPSATDRTAVGGGTAAGSGGTSPVTAGSAAQSGSRPQTTAAVSGLVTALLALIIVITTFTVQLVYRDYYTCVNDALTKVGTVACNDQLPKPLQPLFGVKE